MVTVPGNKEELFKYVRTFDLEKIPTLKSIIEQYNWSCIDINELLNIITTENNFLLIDTRSEKEYDNSSIPFSENFPVLSTEERHNVGLIYKKYSKMAALKLALEYAEPKEESLKLFLKKNKAADKNILVNCWRGGGRSSYLAKMVCDLGYKPATLLEGFKSYRNKVFEFFSKQEFLYDLIELSGLTGSGKTEIIKAVVNNFPVIDLELAARHFSSLFGFVPYKIKNYTPVANQSAFENNIFSQIVMNNKYFPNHNTFLIESESKKVGDFLIPIPLYEKLQLAPTIRVECSFNNRIERIVKDYFGNDNEGIPEMKKIFMKSERFFRQQLSNPVYDDLLTKLQSGNVNEFTEIMINKYYDIRYKEKPKNPLLIVNSDNIDKAAKELIEYLNNQ
ncbi:MAG: tRNA 2-selenouridine(34) synthase MnmH [Ignavibacteria bacterium]|nr:tRNA 2-selenouridine(34) synthase MnmH [Ignavibacteria bacterium]